jgi:hypothetical protein
MPDVYGPFDTATWSQAQWFRTSWARSRSGVYGSAFTASTTGDLALTVSGLDISMALGRAYVRGAGYERTGSAWTYSVPANTNPTQARIDRLVLRRDLTAKTVVPVVLQGTPAASPVAPTVTQVEDGVWELPLFSFTVPANSAAPVTNVVDERVSGDTETRAWRDYTPALSGITLGNGTLEGRYMADGATVHFAVLLTAGSTTSITGTLVIGLPVACRSVGLTHGPAWRSSPVGVAAWRATSASNTNTYDAATGTTWGSGTSFPAGATLRLSGTYERA